MFKKKEVEEVRESCSPDYEEFMKYHESFVYQSGGYKEFEDDCESRGRIMEKSFSKDLCDDNNEITYIDECNGINFEAQDTSIIVSSEINKNDLESLDSDTEIEKCYTKKETFIKKVHFEDDETVYDNLRENFGWWLEQKECRRKSYDEMIPLTQKTTKEDVEKCKKEDVIGISKGKDKLSTCLKILKYFFFLLLILIPLFLFLLAFFGFGLCDIKPTIPHTLYFIGFIIILSFILSILLSLDWSPPIGIFLAIILIIISVILIGLSTFVTYWFSDFYYLLQQQPLHCPTLYCSDRSIFVYVIAIILSWLSLGIILYLNRSNFSKVFTSK